MDRQGILNSWYSSGLHLTSTSDWLVVQWIKVIFFDHIYLSHICYVHTCLQVYLHCDEGYVVSVDQLFKGHGDDSCITRETIIRTNKGSQFLTSEWVTISVTVDKWIRELGFLLYREKDREMVRVQSLQRAPFPQHLLQHPSPASSHSHRVATHVSMYYFI